MHRNKTILPGFRDDAFGQQRHSRQSYLTHQLAREFTLGACTRRSLEAIFTRLAREPAFIFSITFPRWAFTVISLMPSSPAICLFNMPETTNAMTCCSRQVSDA